LLRGRRWRPGSGDDEQALEEIRRFFARYRQVAPHGMVIEHDVPAELRAQEPDEAAETRSAVHSLSSEHVLYDHQGRLASLAAAPAAGGRKRPSSPAPTPTTIPAASSSSCPDDRRVVR
jgi:hypothetical protein